MSVRSLDEALKNLIDGVKGKGAKYDAKQPNMVRHFREGLSRLGVTVGPVTLNAYDSRTKGKGKKLEDNAIAGAQAKWIDNYKAGFAP